ncbi:hypothetical protein UY3_06823 [Chelonia mydas]|uniref:Myb/SANT-like DNA-binding domain-containing protein n=1 Tax=Chelonia mydas TaxID=8469 RepID=M7BDI5_CHEMY|nr:hypothetical protein UY3_06823 [Chelonia mydas]
MVDRVYNRDTQQCCLKIKEIRQAYQKEKKANGRSGSEPQTCHFYDQLHAILVGDPTSIPPLSVDTCKVAASCNMDEDFVDEEEEEEENAQQATGESIFPSSRDLFLTLEPKPAQTLKTEKAPLKCIFLKIYSPFPPPPAANVSMLPASAPSLRLSQIRRQKERTRDDMFSELMQSSCTDRTQLNAWKPSMAEARKAYSECDQNTQEEMLRLMGEQTDMMRHLVELQERQLEYRPP